MSKKYKVLVVDDSAFMRKSLSIMLESDDEIEVVGTGRNGLEAVNLVKSLQPDIITLDIEMPVMDGLTALGKIMSESPIPVIMVSSLTTEGADSTLKALELGAVDFIPKGMSYANDGLNNIKRDLIKKVKSIVKQKSLRTRISNIQARKNLRQTIISTSVETQIKKKNFKAIALGISTGGPLSLQKVIPNISSSLKLPIFIVQHMPPKFTKSLAERLNSLSGITVKEAENGEKIQGGIAYIAPGGQHMKVISKLDGKFIKVDNIPEDSLYKPSVDIMLDSVIEVYRGDILGIIMTGMGKDGLIGIKRLKGLGGSTIAQDEESCVVYGMPKAIVDNGFADAVLPLGKIASEINRVLK